MCELVWICRLKGFSGETVFLISIQKLGHTDGLHTDIHWFTIYIEKYVMPFNLKILIL